MWFLAPEFRERYDRAVANGYQPSAEQSAQWAAGFSEASADSLPRILSIAGDNAEIAINGILTGTPDFMAFLFGGGNTTYADILASIAFVEQAADVTNVTFAVDSPGGEVAGLFTVLDAIAAMKKPTKATARAALSAAYAIVSVTGSIAAENQASQFGSVGIMTTATISENKVHITSTEAPNKAPDVTTAKGKAVVREHLDAVHEIFVQAIARGRGTTAENINETFGRGSSILATDAIARGMIDSIVNGGAQSAQRTTAKAEVITLPTAQATTEEGTTMDMAKLRAEYPALVAQIETEARDIGVTAERDRVTAHLIMGEASDCMATAVTAIKDGSVMTATLNAEYAAAGLRRAGTAAAVEDDDAAAAALAAAGGDDAAAAAVVVKPDANGSAVTADTMAALETNLGIADTAAAA